MKAFAAALAWSHLSVLVPILMIAGTGSALAQFSVGGDRPSEGTRGDGDRRGGMRGNGVGIGIGIGIGSAIIENAAEENANKKTGAGSTAHTRTRDPKKPKRAARKGDDDTPTPVNPRKTPTDQPPDKHPKTVTKDDKKDDGKKKTPEDPTDGPKPPVDPTDLAIDDCVVIIQYEKDQIPTAEEDPTSAQNEDIKASAELIKNAETGTVTKDNHFEDVIKGFKKKGCCKRIQIFGHGTTGVEYGQLKLPYKIADSDMLGGIARENMGGDAADAWDGFTKTLKDALCKDPKAKPPPTTPQVKVNACYSAKHGDQGEGSPIADELAKSGIRTSGWTGVCDFSNGEKPVLPEGHDDSREKTFLPPDPAKK